MKTSRTLCLIVSFLCLINIKLGQANFWLPESSPIRIALLLPLTGPLGESGQAIRDGFLAAYYQSLSEDPQAPTIRIVDTNGSNIIDLYHQAIEQGANVIVGPLNKPEGLQLVQAGTLSVPTLLLNNLQLSETVPNLFQLSLTPEDEVKQLVTKAWGDQHKNAIVILPANNWGQRAGDVFLKEWQDLGGKVVGEMFYDNHEKLATQVSQVLHVQQSEQRAKELQRLLLQKKMRTIPYRRQDVDMVFLAAKPDLARELRPLLGFYFAGKIPVYSTSLLYAGFPNPQYDKDLDGIVFCAIPWVIAADNLPAEIKSILTVTQKIWPQVLLNQPQFFALGVDGYNIARQLSKGNAPPTINAATGRLTLQDNKIWTRQLPWAQMVNGAPELLSSASPRNSRFAKIAP